MDIGCYLLLASKFSTIIGSRAKRRRHFDICHLINSSIMWSLQKLRQFLHDSINMFKCHKRERERVFTSCIDSRQDIFQTSHLDATSNVSRYIATVPFRHIGRSQIVIGVKITWFILNDVRAATRDRRHTATD